MKILENQRALHSHYQISLSFLCLFYILKRKKREKPEGSEGLTIFSLSLFLFKVFSIYYIIP